MKIHRSWKIVELITSEFRIQLMNSEYCKPKYSCIILSWHYLLTRAIKCVKLHIFLAFHHKRTYYT